MNADSPNNPHRFLFEFVLLFAAGTLLGRIAGYILRLSMPFTVGTMLVSGLALGLVFALVQQKRIKAGKPINIQSVWLFGIVCLFTVALLFSLFPQMRGEAYEKAIKGHLAEYERKVAKLNEEGTAYADTVSRLRNELSDAELELKEAAKRHPTDGALAAALAQITEANKRISDLETKVEEWRQAAADLQTEINGMRNAPPQVVVLTAPTDPPTEDVTLVDPHDEEGDESDYTTNARPPDEDEVTGLIPGLLKLAGDLVGGILTTVFGIGGGGTEYQAQVYPVVNDIVHGNEPDEKQLAAARQALGDPNLIKQLDEELRKLAARNGKNVEAINRIIDQGMDVILDPSNAPKAVKSWIDEMEKKADAERKAMSLEDVKTSLKQFSALSASGKFINMEYRTFVVHFLRKKFTEALAKEVLGLDIQ